MSKYELLLTIHILAAIVWLGASVTLLTLGYHLRERAIETRVEFTRWTEWFGPRVIAPASVAIIVTGPLLVTEVGGFEFDQAWIHVGFTGWFISFLLGVAFYPREGRKRERLIEEQGMGSAAVAGSVQRVLRVASVDTLIITLVVLAMTTKPGL